MRKVFNEHVADLIFMLELEFLDNAASLGIKTIRQLKSYIDLEGFSNESIVVKEDDLVGLEIPLADANETSLFIKILNRLTSDENYKKFILEDPKSHVESFSKHKNNGEYNMKNLSRNPRQYKSYDDNDSGLRDEIFESYRAGSKNRSLSGYRKGDIPTHRSGQPRARINESRKYGRGGGNMNTLRDLYTQLTPSDPSDAPYSISMESRLNESGISVIALDWNKHNTGSNKTTFIHQMPNDNMLYISESNVYDSNSIFRGLGLNKIDEGVLAGQDQSVKVLGKINASHGINARVSDEIESIFKAEYLNECEAFTGKPLNESQDIGKLEEAAHGDGQPYKTPKGKHDNRRVNGKALKSYDLKELREMLKEAKKDLKSATRELKSCTEGTSKYKTSKKSVAQLEGVVKMLQEQISDVTGKALKESNVIKFGSFLLEAEDSDDIFPDFEDEDEDEDEDEEDDKDSDDKGDKDDKDSNNVVEMSAVILVVTNVEDVKSQLKDYDIPEEAIEVIESNEDDDDDKGGKLRIDADYAFELKDYLDTKGIDLEEEIGGELEADDDKEDDINLDDDDIFGLDSDDDDSEEDDSEEDEGEDDDAIDFEK